ncbi:MAG: tetratricopeptide repeat protein [Crocinitomicaceae bacterium]|nr:tetratricopeptide repeat protein [Flavobacteriales bacterium]NQZ36296.1 tetratricopeptide repeat protein [Crocinitomicaceae bacterium]
MRIIFSLFLVALLSNVVFSQDDDMAESAFDDGVFNLIVGKYEKAKENFSQAIEEGEQPAKSYYYLSKARCGLGDFENALVDINESFKLEPEDKLTLDMRGKIYLALDRPSEALTDFKKVLSRDSEFEGIHFSLGRAYYKLDLFEKAISQFNESLVEKPDNSKCYRYRGLSHLLLEMDDEGCNDLSKARKMGESGLDDIINDYCGSIEIAMENKTSEYDWNFYDDPDVIDATNALLFTEFSNDDPESMVNYFYASRIRGDEKWRDVLQPESQWSDRLKYSLAKYEKWNFVNFRLVKKKRHSESGWWIGAYFEIEVNGHKDGGNDEISLTFNGVEWVIINVPN